MSAKEHLYGRERRPSKGRDGTRTALYLRVSTADQKPDLQYDGLRAYAAHAKQHLDFDTLLPALRRLMA